MSNISAEQLLFSAFGVLLIGAVFLALFGRDWRRTGYAAVVFMAAAAVALWTLAARVFTTGDIYVQTSLSLDVIGSSLTFHVDRLSAIFLIMLPFVGLASALFAVDYMTKVYPKYQPARYYVFALLLMAAMVGVVTVRDLLFFIVFWELMTLTSWVLVWFDREDEAKARAAWTYFLYMHVATGFMLIAAMVTYSRAGSFAFPDIARALGTMGLMNPALLHVMLALFVIGFTTKAGLFPFGGWLPVAHPAAPAPASAILSGAMIKTGVYAVLRLFLFLAPVSQVTTIWGGIIAVLGAGSLFVATITALRQDDSKRVLSFHSIGQIGYVFLGVGTGVFFLHSNPAIATVALIAGLYHVINHACFKSLLFLNAGAAEYYTGTRDLNKMGGLGALMPITLVTALIASLAIAGVPPLNGFASKWLIYQSAFQGGLKVPLFLLLVLVAVFISLVTLASFMKMLGAMFLGKLATNGKDVPGDVPASMQISQVAFSVACVVLGFAPILPLKMLYGVAEDAVQACPAYTALFGTKLSGITLSLGHGAVGVWNPAYMIVALAVLAVGAYAVSRSAHAPSRQTEGWYGGEEYEPDLIRFRAHGFALPFKMAFAKVWPSIPVPSIPSLKGIRKVLDLDAWLYQPIVNGGSRVTDRVSRTHSGLPYVYMLWQVIGIILVLAILFALLGR